MPSLNQAPSFLGPVPARRVPPKLPRRDELSALVQPPKPLDLGLLASLPSLLLRARYLVDSHTLGRHRSPLRGAALEFAEYRAYQSGDELRRIDWRLYGRSDRLFVKRYEEENQMRVGLVLDLSASLGYASQPGLMSKSDFARTLLGAIALLARRQHDALALALVGDTGDVEDYGLADYLPPRSSPAHHQTVFAKLDTPPAARTARLPEALTRLADLLPRGSILVIASDFYCDLPPLAEALRHLRARHIECIGLQVLDPMELDFADETAGLFIDLENGNRLVLDAPAVRTGYLKRFNAFRQSLEEIFLNHEADFILQRTDATPLAALSAYIAHRQSRRA